MITQDRIAEIAEEAAADGGGDFIQLLPSADVLALCRHAARYLWLRDTSPIAWPPRIYADASINYADFDRLIDEEIARG